MPSEDGEEGRRRKKGKRKRISSFEKDQSFSKEEKGRKKEGGEGTKFMSRMDAHASPSKSIIFNEVVFGVLTNCTYEK